MTRPHSNRSLVVVAALAALTLLAVACGGGNGAPAPTVGTTATAAPTGESIQVPRSALDALTTYAFTSTANLSSGGTSITANVAGAFQAPNSMQGTLTTGNGESLGGLPSGTEFVLIGQQAWMREPGANWEQSAVDKLFLLALGTPPFYLTALNFDSLRLQVAGPVETVNGVRARPVRLDKSALIDVLRQGIVRNDQGEPINQFQQDLQNALPHDMTVETSLWLAESGGYPVRIKITLTTMDVFLAIQPPVIIRLQMDITDVGTGVEIKPP